MLLKVKSKVKFKEIYYNIMITLLIWKEFSNLSFPPKLINKHCCFSISRPSCCQRMKSRKNLNFSLSVILFWENLCEIKLWWERSSSKIENRYLNSSSIIYWKSGSSANIDIELDLQARIGCSLFAQYKNRGCNVSIKFSMKLWMKMSYLGCVCNLWMK